MSTHLIQERNALTVCCGKNPFELPRGDRATMDPKMVTCPQFKKPDPAKAPIEHRIAAEVARVIVAALILPHVNGIWSERAVVAMRGAEALLDQSKLPALLKELEEKERK